MKAVNFFLLIVVGGVESLVCPDDQLKCGSVDCYDPTIQNCIENDGICYSSDQYCYNDTIVCNNNELVCDIQSSTGPICYDPSEYGCYDNGVCPLYLSCSAKCVDDYDTACANNQTLCPGFDARLYYEFYTDRLDVCGPQQQCYDNTITVCLNGTTLCPGANAQLCGTECFDPDKQICVNDIIQCLSSCNGRCYSNAQFCYNNTIICNNNELVCDIQSSISPLCYDPSRYGCYENGICQHYMSCGGRCVNDIFTACANNQTLCPGFYALFYSLFYKDRLDVCGPQQQCYDNTVSVCLGDNSTVCPIGNQLCSGLCYDPRSQYCAGGNNTIYCLSNPSESNCLSTTTMTTSMPLTNVSNCCGTQECTTNSDCCQSDSLECQCYRHITSDVYGSCHNPYTIPVCADGCPVEGKCKSDSDCCKCQCAEVTLTDLDGNLLTKKRCIQR